MELVIVSVGVLVVLIVTAAVMDLRARRSRRRISVDPAGVLDARRINEARGDLHNPGRDAGPGPGGGGF
jgi:hypothetical protein